jgi:transcription initiation factor TFIIE subunit alpha
MQVNLLKTVVSSIAGQPASPIVDLLHDKKNVNEFLIAKKLKLTINQTRNILYRLADEGIVSFIRKKDRKKGGWYIYFWTLNTGKGLIRFRDHLLSTIDSTREQMDKRKTERFFHCPNCQIESNEESALQFQYTCPECGEVMQLKDRGKEVENLEKEIARLEGVLVGVVQEIGVISKKEDAVKVRKAKAEAKKKSKERALKKKKKEKEMKKMKRVKKKKPIRKAKKSFGGSKAKSFGGSGAKSFGGSLGKKLKKFLRR